MRINNILIPILVSIVVLSSCDDKKVDTEAVKKELDARKIKKVKPGEIIAYAEKKGADIIALLQKTDTSKHDSIIQANHCEYKIVNSNNTEVELNGIERSILEAYKYSLEQKSRMPDNIQPIEKGNRIIFTRAQRVDSITVEMQVITMWRKFIVLDM